MAGLVGVLLVMAPAAAHSDLESSDPSSGATLAEAPARVTFTFNEDLLEQGNAITLTEVATGMRLELGDVAVSGDSVSVGWPAASPAGEFRAAYRVVSADGHPIDGTITFTVAQAVGPTSTGPTAEPVDGLVPSDSSSAPDVVPVAEPAADATWGSGPAVWVLVLGVGAVVLAGVGAGALLRRGR